MSVRRWYRLAECPVCPLLKSRCTEGFVERGLTRSNGRDVPANLLRLPEGPGVGEEPTDKVKTPFQYETSPATTHPCK